MRACMGCRWWARLRLGSFSMRLLPGAGDTADLVGVLERLPGVLDPVATVSREVGVPACEIGGRTTQ